MAKKLLSKWFITFGLLLFFTLLLPNTIVKADDEKDYKLNVKSISLVKGDSFTLRVYNLSANARYNFKSGDEEIASVSNDGTITANKAGDTTIIVTIKDGATVNDLKCDVTVGLPAFSVKLTRSRIILGLDKTDTLNVILKPSNTFEAAKFSSKDSSIVSVSPLGRITAKKFGLTYVFAEIGAINFDGTRKFSRCTVIVTTQEDVPLLDKYFNDHSELDYIPEEDLTIALDEYFNTKYDPSVSLPNSLNRYLDEKFDLTKLRAKKDIDYTKIQSNSLGEAISVK